MLLGASFLGRAVSLHLMRGVGVQARSRLVHEQHTRVRDERNAYVCALCLQQQEPTGNLLKVGIRLFNYKLHKNPSMQAMHACVEKALCDTPQ